MSRGINTPQSLLSCSLRAGGGGSGVQRIQFQLTYTSIFLFFSGLAEHHPVLSSQNTSGSYSLSSPTESFITSLPLKSPSWIIYPSLLNCLEMQWWGCWTTPWATWTLLLGDMECIKRMTQRCKRLTWWLTNLPLTKTSLSNCRRTLFFYVSFPSPPSCIPFPPLVSLVSQGQEVIFIWSHVRTD